MLYGAELIKKLEGEIATYQEAISNRMDRIGKMETDWDDCFVSQRCEERGISNAQDKIRLIRDGGTAWFSEYATLDGKIVNARWCNTKFGTSLRVEMPDGSVVRRKGLKQLNASALLGTASKVRTAECLAYIPGVMCFSRPM